MLNHLLADILSDLVSETDVRLLLRARGNTISTRSMETFGLGTPDDFDRWADEVKLLANCLRTIYASKVKPDA